jgi:hypothetical protein
MHLYSEEKRIATQGTGIECKIFQGDPFITTVSLQLNKFMFNLLCMDDLRLMDEKWDKVPKVLQTVKT